jgi:hypothetical protein
MPVVNCELALGDDTRHHRSNTQGYKIAPPQGELNATVKRNIDEQGLQNLDDLDREVTEKEDLLQEANRMDGSFDLRGKVGGWWTKAGKENPKMLTDYKNVGRSYQKQREFRARWVADELQKVQHERVTTAESVDRDGVEGFYKPIRVIIRDEGDDHSAVLAAFNIVAQCVEHFNRGSLYKNRPLIRWNSWSKRYEYAHLRFGFNSDFRQGWKEVNTEAKGVDAEQVAVVDALAGVPETPVKIKAGQASSSKPEVADKKASADDKRKAKGGGAPAAPPPKKSKKAGGHEGGELSPEETKKKMMRKHSEDKWKEMSNIKTAYANAIANHQTLVDRVANDHAWHWAASDMDPDIKEKRQHLDHCIVSSDFFKALAVQDIASLKKKGWDHMTVNTKEVSTAIETLQNGLDRVIRQHNVR